MKCASCNLLILAILLFLSGITLGGVVVVVAILNSFVFGKVKIFPYFQSCCYVQTIFLAISLSQPSGWWEGEKGLLHM